MVEESVSDLELAGEMFEDQLLHLAFSEHMVVTMVHFSFLLCVLNTCLNESAVLWSGLFPLFLRLLISIMQMPRDKDVLSGELTVLLLVSPHVDEHGAFWSQDSMHLRQSLHPKRVA